MADSSPIRRAAVLNTTEFVRLLAQHQRSVYAFIYSMIPNWADADDVFQATNVKLWEQIDRFEPGTDFGAWARSVAYYCALNFRRDAGRERVHFSQTFIDAVHEEVEAIEPEVQDIGEALEQCIKKLPDKDRKLLDLFYGGGLAVKAVAERVGRSAAATYKAISRTRLALRQCIDRRLANGESS